MDPFTASSPLLPSPTLWILKLLLSHKTDNFCKRPCCCLSKLCVFWFSSLYTHTFFWTCQILFLEYHFVLFLDVLICQGYGVTNKVPGVHAECVFSAVTCCCCWNAITSTIKSGRRSKPIRWVQSEGGGGSSCLSTARECRLLRRDNVGIAEEESVLVTLLLTVSDVSVEIERTPPSDRGSCFRLISEFLSSDSVLWVSQIRCNVRTWSHCSQLHFKF